ncbi:MAG: efflux RND transporter permease subunit [Chlorobiota bacterium]|nr:MAG: efflux RND transporter permease subunit [Chlorobiota bacterium]
MIGVTTFVLVAFGVVALIMMPRDEFPQFTIRQGIVIGIYPGASAEQVEEQLTKKVESYLFSYESVKKSKTHSISKENLMVIYVEVDENEKNPDAFWAKLRHGLNEMKGQLPAGVLSVTADNDFGNTSAILLSIESDTKTYRDLEGYIKQFEDEVRKIPAVSRVKRYGMQQEQVSIYLDDAKLNSYGIKPLMVLANLRGGGMVSYSGSIDNGTTVSPVHIPLTYRTESDIANQIVYAGPDGATLRLKDFARIEREYATPSSYIRTNGKKCLIVSLEMRPGNNIVSFGDDVAVEIDKMKNKLPPDVNFTVISSLPDAVSGAIANFLKEFLIAIISVILVTIVLLPGRVAMVAASTIPVSIMITIGILWAFGVDLQTVSLAGLIIVLGMVVDNAIVIIDNYVEELDLGMTPWDAATRSVVDLFGSVFLATMIIISFFAPMVIFMTGVGRDFVGSLPLTVTIALLVSLGTAAILVPLMSYFLIKHGIAHESQGRKAKFLGWIQKWYEKGLDWSFQHKKTVVAIGAASFLLGLGILAITPQESFPRIDRNQFAAEIYFPSKNYGQFLVITESNEATLEILDEYSVKYSNKWPEANIKWKQLDFMPERAPVEVRISGDSIRTIKKVADEVMALARTCEGASWIRTDFENPVQAVNLNLKSDEISRLGYSSSMLAYSIMTGTEGFPVSTVWEGDYPVNVTMLVDKKVKRSVDEIMNMSITAPFVVTSVPLRQLVDARPAWNEGTIARRNGVRTLTVRVDVVRGLLADNIFRQLRGKVDKMDLPEGVSISYGGEYAMSGEHLTPLGYSMVTSIILAFLILLLKFRKTGKSIAIMLTMPLSVFGAAFGVWVMNYPFSVTAFIGLIGLMGIVVRNGIILVGYAEDLRKQKHISVLDAAVAAAKRRMRPIFLTSAAAAVGVVPMVMSGSSLWGPLGSVICFGLIFGMILSLFLLPVLYYYVERHEDKHPEEVVAR